MQVPLHQLSHPSPFPSPPPPPPFLIAAVPIELPLLLSTPASPKESQKSLRSGSTAGFDRAVLPSPVFSTKELNRSAAPLVPVWIVFAACVAVRRACAVRSDSAICISYFSSALLNSEGKDV